MSLQLDSGSVSETVMQSVHLFFLHQSFGIAEGRRVQEVREMAKAAGQSFPGFTPPKGETQEQVSLVTEVKY